MSAVKQIAAVVGMNTRAMTSRAGASLVIVGGMAAVVAVALSIFSMSAGLERSIQLTAPTPDRMAIVSAGALDGGPSSIPRAAVAIIGDTPGIKKGPDGKPLISPTVSAAYLTRRKDNGVETYVGVTGVAPNILYRRPEVKISDGRLFTPGLHEALAGKGAAARFENLAVGSTAVLPDGPWTIVGIFEGAGTSDYGLWVDSDTLAAALRRNSYAVVFARLEDGSPAARAAFKDALTTNPALSVEAETEQENRARGGTGSSIRFYAFLAYGVGAIMGLGTIFAALNTMYAAVSARTAEIATLRAIGFGAMPVVISVIIEALGLAVIGAIAGAVIAWVGFNGRGQNFGASVISQIVTPEMVIAAIAASLLIGLIGGLFPAIRAARLPIAQALQQR